MHTSRYIQSVANFLGTQLNVTQSIRTAVLSTACVKDKPTPLSVTCTLQINSTTNIQTYITELNQHVCKGAVKCKHFNPDVSRITCIYFPLY